MRNRILFTAALALACVAANAQWTDPALDTPAYHAAPPAKGASMKPILHGAQLTGPGFQFPWQVRVYQEAAKIPNVLYQEPCYCHCDRALGHTSLHSCFSGMHGAECGTCAKEGHYAYLMTRKGWTPKQIRAGIERGDWQKIDLESLNQNPPRAPKHS